MACLIKGNLDFDIFALDYYAEKGSENKDPPYGNYFLILIIIAAVLIIIMSIVLYTIKGFKLDKSMSYILIGTYVVYFLLASTFAMLTRLD